MEGSIADGVLERSDGVYDVRVQRLSDRRVATFFALVLMSGFCISVLAYRSTQPNGHFYDFLAWNLLLAWIPFLLAVALYDSDRRGRTPAVLVILGAVWLVFLPNAPYIVTDFVHIGELPGAPLWYDAGMTAAFAGTGLVLGLASVLLVQGVVARRFGALGRMGDARAGLRALQRRHLHRADSPTEQLGRDHAPATACRPRRRETRRPVREARDALRARRADGIPRDCVSRALHDLRSRARAPRTLTFENDELVQGGHPA